MFCKETNGAERIIQGKKPGRKLQEPVLGFRRREVLTGEVAHAVAGSLQELQAEAGGLARWSWGSGARKQAFPDGADERFCLVVLWQSRR